MKKIEFIIGIIIVGAIAFLEISARRKREKNDIPYTKLHHEDVWWGN